MPSQVVLERLALLGPVDCSSFVEVKGHLYCSIEEAVTELESANTETTPTHVFDHTHPNSAKTAPVVIVYAELGTSEFASLHVAMTTLVEEGRVRYVLRHYEAVGHMKEVKGHAMCEGCDVKCALIVCGL